MRISSRTPEGEPLRCNICGQRSFVLPSHPPGDSTCPNCGCFAWVTSIPADPASDIEPDLTALKMALHDISRCTDAASVVTALDVGLQEILHPDAVVIWNLEGENPQEPQLTPSKQQSEQGNLNFACVLMRRRRSVAKRQGCVEPFRFTLGLPWLEKKQGRILGAIELSYTHDVTEYSENVISRIAQSFAVIAAGKFIRVAALGIP